MNKNPKPKILLVHGWSYDYYTSSGNKEVWSNRRKFVKALLEFFEVVVLNLPGFGGAEEPKNPMTLDDLADFLGKAVSQIQPEYLLGYSFGGAVCLRFKDKTQDRRIKTFLISPAIMRRYEKKTPPQTLVQWSKKFFPKKLFARLRNLYLTRIVKNPFYVKASLVMRATYSNIVGLDLREELRAVTDSLTLIYGDSDTATPVDLVKGILSACPQHRLEIIQGGGHDIANTHTAELVEAIVRDSR